MDAANHRGITRQALEGTFGTVATRIITDGNVDSDKPGAGGECAEQHFHFHGSQVSDPETVIARSTEFWQSCMKHAALLARSKDDNHKELALYFLGRGFHCAQDFYAHSNYVALLVGAWWDGTMKANLTFCLPTPGNTGQKIKANRAGYWPDLKSTGKHPKTLQGSDLKRASVARMRDGQHPIPHPELHLDFPGSWADRALYEVYQVRAWDKASYGATMATIGALDYFETEIKKAQNKTSWTLMKSILLSEGYKGLGGEVLDGGGGKEALDTLTHFKPMDRSYSSISARSVAVFKKAQRKFMDLQFSRFGGAMWNLLQSVSNR